MNSICLLEKPFYFYIKEFKVLNEFSVAEITNNN